MPTQSATPCPVPVAKAINALRVALATHYHACDYSFTIVGQGRILSASTMTLGDVRPTPYDAEQQAEARERELDAQHPIDA